MCGGAEATLFLALRSFFQTVRIRVLGSTTLILLFVRCSDVNPDPDLFGPVHPDPEEKEGKSCLINKFVNPDTISPVRWDHLKFAEQGGH